MHEVIVTLSREFRISRYCQDVTATIVTFLCARIYSPYHPLSMCVCVYNSLERALNMQQSTVLLFTLESATLNWKIQIYEQFLILFHILFNKKTYFFNDGMSE